ncbi:MAG: hypothetical protein DWQ47_14360 [Acidobacteria bacterium]|nr:MAG: hypothetical protein DWQ32_01760 [Acidobacteriota bacterium]REK02748.1 MAG: hypothetical protein DWQ38_10375 [Acidobacteriota bacterium]REK13447.1 MAG: hypothetical protein DWQ43_07450 [Acidobacteriota bacterium]REK41441.1 MAG: hypothetical protein DWQ47_14360 [Acidobacteriota bacterium]
MALNIRSENKVVKAIAEGTAPRPAQLAAAKGILPLPQADLLEALAVLARCEDDEIAKTAKETLLAQEEGKLLDVVASPEAPPLVLDHYAINAGSSHAVYEAVVSNPATPHSSLVGLAKTSRNPELLELLALNQQLLIKSPEIIDAILQNPNKSAEAERRARETKREFFEKERGAEQIARELRAQGKEAAAEFIESAEFTENLAEGPDAAEVSVEDALLLAELIEVPDAEVDDSWLSLEYVEEIYEETEAERQAVVDKIVGEFRSEAEDELTAERISMISRVMKMNMRDRMKLAMKGNREARTVLIRDPNKIISTAVIQNPKITEQEVEQIANMRTISGDVLRSIATNLKWARNYKIVLNICLNPRSPLANVMSFLPRLQMKDLKAIPNNKNVPEAVRKNALRIVNARAGR